MVQYTYGDMVLLADEVMRQKAEASYRTDLNTLTSKSGKRVARMFVYPGNTPWLVEEAMNRAEEQDRFMWEFARDNVARKYVQDQVASWPSQEGLIDVFRRGRLRNN